MSIEMVRKLNLALTAIGVAVFAGLFLYLTFAPEDFDQRTRDFAIAKVEARIDETLSAAADSSTADRLSEIAGVFSERLQERVDTLRGSLDAGLDVFIADVLAAACELDCERREQARQAARGFFEGAIARYGVAIDRLESIIVGEYQAIMGELRADLKIFSGSNFIALGFALLLAIFRGRAAAHLLPISVSLTLATALMIVWYVFGQDWVMAVVFNDYWGWAYAIVLAILSAFMIDIAVNKARATSFVFNIVGHTFGGAFQFSPC